MVIVSFPAPARERAASEFGLRYHLETWIGAPAVDLADAADDDAALAEDAECDVRFSLKDDVVQAVTFSGEDCVYPEPPTTDLGVDVEETGDGLVARDVAWPSIARRFGLQDDDVLVSAGGRPLASLYDWRRLLADVDAEGADDLAVTVERDGVRQDLALRLDERYNGVFFYLTN